MHITIIIIVQVTHQYSRRPLRQPLLHLATPADRTAAIALWKTILRFMIFV